MLSVAREAQNTPSEGASAHPVSRFTRRIDRARRNAPAYTAAFLIESKGARFVGALSGHLCMLSFLFSPRVTANVI
jgi:hypothetical protein